MANLITYSKASLIERIEKHLNNGWPNESWPITQNEMLLYIDQSLAFTMVGQAYQGAKIEGALVVPEAWYKTYQLPALAKDSVTREWYSTLPQTPVSLPLGYSLTECYFANTVYGKGTQVFLIRSKRAPYRNNLPKPFGISAKVNGTKIIFEASNGASLLSQNCYVTMATTRTESLTEEMNLPDDAIENIFNSVVQKVLQRFNIPSDDVKDDLPQGKKEA